MLPHLLRRHMAGIDRRIAGGEQRQQRRLRPLQFENRLVVAVRHNLGNIVVPFLARVAAEPVLGLPLQQVHRAFDIGGGERLAVVPFDALAQFERQFLAVLAPRPALGQIGNDVVHAVLFLVLAEQDEVVHDAHDRHDDRIGRLLVDRHAGRAVPVLHDERAAGFLRHGRSGAGGPQRQDRRRQDGGSRNSASVSEHKFLPRGRDRSRKSGSRQTRHPLSRAAQASPAGIRPGIIQQLKIPRNAALSCTPW